MGLLSFQHQTAQQYLGANSMRTPTNLAGVGEYRDPGAEMAQTNTPLPISSSTIGSFGQSTSWRSKHTGFHSLQKGNMKTVADFNTAQVDPGMF